ncbi:hypothetical protein ACWCPM_34460 [Streptomyces sp. NPDC002309]
MPTESGTLRSRPSCPEPAREAVTQAITETISASTVRRWLKGDALKPWQHRSWIFIRAPNFRATAQRVLNLYARILDGVPLGTDEYVISVDEQTSIQARRCCRWAATSHTSTSSPAWPPHSGAGALTVDAVALEDRNAAQADDEPAAAEVPVPRPAAGPGGTSVTFLHEWKLSHLPPDTRPLTSVTHYDQLLRHRRAGGGDLREGEAP